LSGKKQKPFLIEHIEITSAAAEGKSITRHDGKVIFIPFAAPGDIADVLVTKQKQSYAEGSISRLIQASDIRTEPKCIHFGRCGGCKWQHVKYSSQLVFKEEQVKNDMQRIAKVEVEEFLPIKGSEDIYHYRNKLEFTFSNKAWEEHFDKNDPQRIPALGFHMPGMFDKVLDLQVCYLAPPIANRIRDAVKAYAIQHNLSFFDIRQQNGLLRNLMLRCTSANEWMVVLIVSEDENNIVNDMFKALAPDIPEVVEWCYVVNNKKNDTWSDLEVHTYKGQGFLQEKMEDLVFKIRPQSFFQTNAKQALELYRITRDFADLKGTETVYDLYTGTGTIAQFVARKCRLVVGIEYVETAIKDAMENAEINHIDNTFFYAGDMKQVLNDELVAKHGRPDVIITDPPRDGMHPDVVAKINELLPEKIVYVSCNPATQARDIALLDVHYKVKKIQPVDMFPHTHHVESVALLIRRA
jgi:23S rRNA (uracil1939-C5)-methyltransferase